MEDSDIELPSGRMFILTGIIMLIITLFMFFTFSLFVFDAVPRTTFYVMIAIIGWILITVGVYLNIKAHQPLENEEKVNNSKEKHRSRIGLYICLFVLLFVLNPVISPISAIRDSDLDGVSDLWDSYPYDSRYNGDFFGPRPYIHTIAEDSEDYCTWRVLSADGEMYHLSNLAVHISDMHGVTKVHDSLLNASGKNGFSFAQAKSSDQLSVGDYFSLLKSIYAAGTHFMIYSADWSDCYLDGTSW